jgi:hypothetical protein
MKLSLALVRDFLLFLIRTILTRVESPFHCLFDLVARLFRGRVSGIGSLPAALAVTDELVLPLRAVGDLATDAGVSQDDVVIITQCASLGEFKIPSLFPCYALHGRPWDWFTTMAAGTESNVAPMSCLSSYLCSASIRRSNV